MNDEMDDFSTPGKKNAYGFEPSPANFIQPFKRPQSSMCPTIVLKNGEVEFLVGAAGGSKITASVASTLLRYLLLNEDTYDAVNNKRLHHQLAPMILEYETGYDEAILNTLRNNQHVLKEMDLSHGFNAVTAIGKRGGLSAVFDSRRGGSSAIVKMSKKKKNSVL